ncbi:Skp1 family protein [Podospora appendiculata]|uniref:Elongin-C n=1 Tax=Podospora appendiculata TaxID=314037 RepID=A0AAE0WYD6_9PEZI|nr:Skp1 family protein [Podospora appendiculata]KAK3683966.1 Skp1 family protein [Podospora appendiculata]
MAANRDEPSKYVTLISNDGFEFVLLREATVVSPTIKAMLRDGRQWREATTGRCEFPDISGAVLEKVVEYFQYWYKNRDKLDVPDMDIPVEICLELLVAADYLGLDSKPPLPSHGA